MSVKECGNYRNLVAAVTPPFQSIHIMEKAETMRRCHELCGEMRQECLDLALQEKYPAEKSSGNG